MTIIFLIIIVLQGGVRYQIEEFSDWTTCREHKAEVEAEVVAIKAQLVRSECFDVGRVVSK